MTAPATFRQADLERAVKVALKLGLPVAGFEIAPDGRIVVHTVKDEDEPKGWGE